MSAETLNALVSWCAIATALVGMIGIIVYVDRRLTKAEVREEERAKAVSVAAERAAEKEERTDIRLNKIELVVEGVHPVDFAERLRTLEERTHSQGLLVQRVDTRFTDFVEANTKRLHDMREHLGGQIMAIHVAMEKSLASITKSIEKVNDRLDAMLHEKDK